MRFLSVASGCQVYASRGADNVSLEGYRDLHADADERYP